jgi:hypothetical protein
MSIDDPQKQKLVSAIEQLEAEFQRRQEERQRELDEKFAQGHVRVVGIPSEADKEFEGVIIVTGVPRAERDQETPEWRRLIEERSPSYPTRPHRPKATSEAKNGPADVWQPESEPRPVRRSHGLPRGRMALSSRQVIRRSAT